jgi:hypothetical protein
MRNRTFFTPFKDEGELIASWGEARLIKYLDGKLVLKGGSKEDLVEAREWISMFLNDKVVRESHAATGGHSTPPSRGGHNSGVVE